MMTRIKTVSIALVGLLLLLVTAAWAAVEIEYFEGHWMNNQVHLQWRTASEANIASFKIWRSTQDLPVTNGTINTSLATPVLTKAATGGCSANASNTYSDTDTSVDPQVTTYYYYIEVTKCAGGTEFFDNGTGQGLQVSHTVGYNLYMPLVIR